MMKQHIFLYLILVLMSAGAIQSKCIAQVDSSYVRTYEQPFSVMTYVQKKFVSVEYEYDNKREELFSSNNPVGLGLGFTWKKTSISGSISLPSSKNKLRGKTKLFDFQHHYYGRKFVSDIFIQQYKGFYKEDIRTGEPIHARPDMEIVRYGASGQYIFNNRKFSASAAFSNSELQLKSAGTFLLGGDVYYTKIQSDSILSKKDKYKQKNLQIGVSGGYAYTYVFKKKYYITGSLSIGLNVGTDDISDFYKHKIQVYPSFLPRIAAGYNARSWTLSFSAIYQNSNILRDKDGRLNLGTGNVQLTVVKRIDFYHKLLDKIPRT